MSVKATELVLCLRLPIKIRRRGAVVPLIFLVQKPRYSEKWWPNSRLSRAPAHSAEGFFRNSPNNVLENAELLVQGPSPRTSR